MHLMTKPARIEGLKNLFDDSCDCNLSSSTWWIQSSRLIDLETWKVGLLQKVKSSQIQVGKTVLRGIRTKDCNPILDSWFQGWGAIKQSAFSRKFPGYCLARPIVAACLSPVVEPVPAQLVTVHFQLWALPMLKAEAITSSLLHPLSPRHLCYKFWLSRTSYWRKGSLLSSSIWSGVKSEAGLRKYGQTHHDLQHRKWPAF